MMPTCCKNRFQFANKTAEMSLLKKSQMDPHADP